MNGWEKSRQLVLDCLLKQNHKKKKAQAFCYVASFLCATETNCQIYSQPFIHKAQHSYLDDRYLFSFPFPFYNY